MRLKTFTAASMKEAIATVRQEMGPDAIIVSAYERPRGRGVEVRAAVEGKPATPAPASRAAPSRPANPATPSLPEKPITRIARRRVGQARPAAHEEIVRTALAFHGLDTGRAERFLDACRKLSQDSPAQALTAALDARLSFLPLPERPRRPVMLVGGAGVGKTVTTAKLAARARLAGHGVAVITTDTLRSGAVDQLAKLAKLMGAKVATADAPGALGQLLAAAARTGHTPFIDTPGTNALAIGERRDLRRFLAAGDIEPVLVVAAGSDTAETAEHARLFAEIGVKRFIMTRLDASRRLGGLVAAADEAGLALAQVSLSPYLSEPLGALSAATLARILLAQAAPARAPAAPDHKEQRAS